MSKLWWQVEGDKDKTRERKSLWDSLNEKLEEMQEESKEKKKNDAPKEKRKDEDEID